MELGSFFFSARTIEGFVLGPAVINTHTHIEGHHHLMLKRRLYTLYAPIWDTEFGQVFVARLDLPHQRWLVVVWLAVVSSVDGLYAVDL